MKLLDGFTDSVDMSLSRVWEIVKDREAWHAAVHMVTKNQTWLSSLLINKFVCDLVLGNNELTAKIKSFFFLKAALIHWKSEFNSLLKSCFKN